MAQIFTYDLINDCKTVIEVGNFRESQILVCRLNLFNKMKKVIFDQNDRTSTHCPPPLIKIRSIMKQLRWVIYFLKFICSDYIRWNLKDHVASKVETELSRFENWTSQIYSFFLLIPLIVLHSPQDSLHCYLQEENSVMDRYLSQITQWLELGLPYVRFFPDMSSFSVLKILSGWIF